MGRVSWARVAWGDWVLVGLFLLLVLLFRLHRSMEGEFELESRGVFVGERETCKAVRRHGFQCHGEVFACFFVMLECGGGLVVWVLCVYYCFLFLYYVAVHSAGCDFSAC